MRPDIGYLKRKFAEFNSQIFYGKLPVLPIKLSNSRSAFGQFVHPPITSTTKRDPQLCTLRISTRFDLPEQEVEDTLIHEMIHYCIWYNAIQDTGVHGQVFRKFMHEINRIHGRNLTIRGAISQEVALTDNHKRHNLILVLHWNSDALSMTVCARTKIMEIFKYFKAHPSVKSMDWYWSCHPWFNRFPVSRTPKSYKLSQEEFSTYFAETTPLDFDGRRFHIKTSE